MPSHLRARVRDGIERHLRREPQKLSKSRIKRLRGMSRPQFRLRIDDVRVFYDVKGGTVEVLAVISKEQAEGWLEAEGTADPRGTSREGEG